MALSLTTKQKNKLRKAKFQVISIMALPFLLSVFLSCTPRPNDSSDLRAFTDARWIYENPVEFMPALTDSCAQMDVVLLLRHGNAFEYSSIWLEVRRPVGSDSIARDTFNLALAAPDGAWLGKGLGLSFQIQDTILRNVTVEKDRPWTVRHLMRCDTLLHIEQIGLGFDQSN